MLGYITIFCTPVPDTGTLYTEKSLLQVPEPTIHLQLIRIYSEGNDSIFGSISEVSVYSDIIT